MKLALRGAVLVAALAVVVFMGAALGLESWRFAPGAILALRIVLPLALLALIGVFFVRPLLRRVTDDQVALYLEEHEPSLQAEIISAVEASRTPGASSALVKRLIESAVERCRAIEQGRRVERRPLGVYAAGFGAVLVDAKGNITVKSDAVRQALDDPDPSVALQPYAERVRRDTGVDFVVVMRLDRTRYTHPDPERIGEKFIGDLGGAPEGRVFTQQYTGRLGPSERAVVPGGEGGPGPLSGRAVAERETACSEVVTNRFRRVARADSLLNRHPAIRIPILPFDLARAACGSSCRVGGL